VTISTRLFSLRFVSITSRKVSVLDLLPRDSELQSKASADIVLDTWEFGGHTTSVDALWAGVPVLTFAGPSLMSRVSSSLLIHLGQARVLHGAHCVC
jgi:protein O-GlcNAc transferase